MVHNKGNGLKNGGLYMTQNNDKWITRIDDILLSLVTIFLIGMLLSQILLLKEGTRLYLSKVDKMEGEDLFSTVPRYADIPLEIKDEVTVVKSYQNLLRRNKTIMVKMLSHPNEPNVFILINGKKTDDFSKGDSKITVYDGDYIEIDGRALNEPVDFLIKVPDKGLVSPQDGVVLTSEKKIFPIGKIKFKEE